VVNDPDKLVPLDFNPPDNSGYGRHCLGVEVAVTQRAFKHHETEV